MINDWFRSYLYERKHGPLLFLLYINELHKCIDHCSTFHFTDDTNLLCICENYKMLQNQINLDLKSLHRCLLSNKISLNKGKIELIYFHKAGSKIPTDISIKLNGKKILHSKKIKYLDIYLDGTLTGSEQCEEVTNGILAKTRHYVPLSHLKNIYFATSSHLLYGAQVWGQSFQTIIDKISLLQRVAVRTITFSDYCAHTDPIFKKLGILKFKDNIFLQNCLFVYDYFHDVTISQHPFVIFLSKLENLIHIILDILSKENLLYLALNHLNMV